MRTAQFQNSWPVPVRSRRQAGVTLIEVLFVLFITGVGLLALLTLFPLGVLELSQEIQDDRAAKLALDASAFSAAGEDLLARTREFIADSFVDRSADPQAAAQLRAAFEELGLQAADLEDRLAQLRPLIPRPKLRLQLLASLIQIKAIHVAAGKMLQLLRLLEQPNPPPDADRTAAAQ